MPVTLLHAGTAAAYATLADAVAASRDGDTIALPAGVYLNDTADIGTRITIRGTGGMARLVATRFPLNGRAILRTHADVTLENLEISGATALSGNGAGVMVVGGNLVMRHCYVHDNQDGLLAGPDVAALGRIEISFSEFDHNGTGDGYTHNIYVGTNSAGFAAPANTLVITDSLIHDAVVGHEVKSRASLTRITGSTIGSTGEGTGSYAIDLPNGGDAVIANNRLMKGPGAMNNAFVHVGGEGFMQPGSRVSLTGNIVASALDGDARLIAREQDTPVVVRDGGNRLWRVTGDIAGDVPLESAPAIGLSPPWLSQGRTGHWRPDATGRGDGDWTDTRHWSGGAVPGDGDAVAVAGLGVPARIEGADQAAASLTLADPQAVLVLSGETRIDGAIVQSGGRIALSGRLRAASLTQSSGAVWAGRDSRISIDRTLAIDGSATLEVADMVAGDVDIGGTLRLFGGTGESGETRIGSPGGATLMLDGASWQDRGAMRIGDAGPGRLSVRFGATLRDAEAVLVRGTGSVGGNGVWHVAGDMTAGLAGAAELDISVAGTGGAFSPGHVTIGGRLVLGGAGRVVAEYGGTLVADGLRMAAGAEILVQQGALVDLGGDAAAGAGLLVRPGHVLSGGGRVSASVHDDGLILAEGAGAVLTLAGPVLGSGRLAASAGATLRLEQGPLDPALVLDPGEGTIELPWRKPSLPDQLPPGAVVRDDGTGGSAITRR